MFIENGVTVRADVAANQPNALRVSVTNWDGPLAAGIAQDGTDITSPTAMPTGGVGIRGWLSAIWTKLNGTLTTSVSNFPATQPVSGSVSVSNPTTSPETGLAKDATFTKDADGGIKTHIQNLPATQPVSGSVSVSNLPATQPVSGSVSVTNFPATQPVSGTVTANIGTGSLAGITATVVVKADTAGNQANALKVDGSAVTQPVSGPLTDTQLRATAVPVSLATVAVTQATAASLNATVTQQALTKGAQGATGVSCQDLKDAGRVPVVLTVDSVSGITTEALATMTINKGGTVTSATQYTVANGKTLRIQAMLLSVMVPSTVGCASRARFRSAGTVSASSPIFAQVATGTGNTAFNGNQAEAPIPDGIEIAAGQQVGISHVESSAITGSTTTGAGVQICLVGYEY